MMKEKKVLFFLKHSSLDMIYILSLLCIFSFGSLVAVILGANIYKDMKEDMDSNFELRTPLSYISTKVRQHEDIGAISIIKKEGTDALVLESIDDGEICQTWVYEYDGSLYEVYIEKGTAFKLEDGVAMIPSYGLHFDLSDYILKISANDHQGKTQTLSLSFRTAQGGKPL